MTDLDAPGHPLRAKDVEALISTRVDGKPAQEQRR